MKNCKKVDVIILSYAKNDLLIDMTKNCINTLIDSEINNNVFFNVIVIESNSEIFPFQYDNSITIYPNEEFGYNKFMNIGIGLSKNDYICLCNNDLIFHKNWATEMLKEFEKDQTLMSGCPICSLHHPDCKILINTGNYYGYEVRREVIGWCIFLKRELLDKIGRFDPQFKFWYADNDYALTLKKNNINHALITNSVVDHLFSKTLLSYNIEEQYALTYKEFERFKKKWGSV